jgi:U1 small nuclear ribonucleoprotein C
MLEVQGSFHPLHLACPVDLYRLQGLCLVRPVSSTASIVPVNDSANSPFSIAPGGRGMPPFPPPFPPSTGPLPAGSLPPPNMAAGSLPFLPPPGSFPPNFQVPPGAPGFPQPPVPSQQGAPGPGAAPPGPPGQPSFAPPSGAPPGGLPPGGLSGPPGVSGPPPGLGERR